MEAVGRGTGDEGGRGGQEVIVEGVWGAFGDAHAHEAVSAGQDKMPVVQTLSGSLSWLSHHGRKLVQPADLDGYMHHISALRDVHKALPFWNLVSSWDGGEDGSCLQPPC